MTDDNIVKFRPTLSVIDDLETMLILAKQGKLLGLCGYAVFSNEQVLNISTNHAIVNNATVAYCSVLLARTVNDDGEIEISG